MDSKCRGDQGYYFDVNKVNAKHLFAIGEFYKTESYNDSIYNELNEGEE